MPGPRVDPERTPVDPDDLRAAILAAWRKFRPTDSPSFNAASVLVAQSAFETGRWHACMNYNLAGIKSDGSGMHTYYTTLERLPRGAAEKAVGDYPGLVEVAVDSGGAYVTVRVRPDHPWCRFRAYRSLEEAANGHVAILGTARYLPALTWALKENPGEFVLALKRGGYFTGDAKSYRRGVISLYQELADPPLATREQIEAALARLGFSGEPWPRTLADFQRSVGLVADGIPGPLTWEAMREALASNGENG